MVGSLRLAHPTRRSQIAEKPVLLAGISFRQNNSNKFLAKVIPARLSWTHTAPRPVHPRALLEASKSGIGSRWPRKGAERTPNARRLKLHRSRRHSWRHGLFGGSAVTPGQTVRRCLGLKRWVETTQPPGAMQRKASNTARGTLERRRTCGFLPEFPRVCWTSRRPARPRTYFPQAHRPK